MSDRQTNLISNLLEERELSGLTAAQRAFLSSGAWRTCDVAAASRIISALLEQPRKAGTPTRSMSATSPVPAGRYAVEMGNVLRFFRVDRPTDGRWAGRLFLAETIGGRDHGRKIRETREMESVLAEIAKDPVGGLSRYGREIGACGYCNRTLTDETSRVCGIGPDCARRHGVDRRAIVASLLVEA